MENFINNNDYNENDANGPDDIVQDEQMWTGRPLRHKKWRRRISDLSMSIANSLPFGNLSINSGNNEFLDYAPREHIHPEFHHSLSFERPNDDITNQKQSVSSINSCEKKRIRFRINSQRTDSGCSSVSGESSFSSCDDWNNNITKCPVVFRLSNDQVSDIEKLQQEQKALRKRKNFRSRLSSISGERSPFTMGGNRAEKRKRHSVVHITGSMTDWKCVRMVRTTSLSSSNTSGELFDDEMLEEEEYEYCSVIDCTSGRHVFKFNVDGVWCHDQNQNTISNPDKDQMWNSMDVLDSDFDVFEALTSDDINAAANKKLNETTSSIDNNNRSNEADLKNEMIKDDGCHTNTGVLQFRSSQNSEWSQTIPEYDETDFSLPAETEPPPSLPLLMFNNRLLHEEFLSDYDEISRRKCGRNDTVHCMSARDAVRINHLFINNSLRENVLTMSATNRFKEKTITTLYIKPLDS